jgi:hypothetical protein
MVFSEEIGSKFLSKDNYQPNFLQLEKRSRCTISLILKI